ncbi:PBECR2 nuclease fold domain-containing protein [Pseudovibrio sp. SPO723]|uniref:PBECR2 nuclease fold domain-containing protein n=1 Tax=Nesiotobacter zosterae TaxID=392721 RepID=UPI0029C35D3E|nr:PBECR2 nuclease fold domain-containing protein [Pseudovibrio sp. SPO723]MDX5595308.1 PBECR2 nuclease fold domain-containing protein [Pseudovibrio sp. SPO723]
MPSQAWTDHLHQAHDRAFVVAGATKDALLEDFRTAIDDAIGKGVPLKGWLDKNDIYHPGFLDKFDEIVKRHGWDHKGKRLWRARVIYETNLKTAYAAGRYKQMREPATLKVFPYWQYVHAHERVPVQARASHKAWDGLILPATDPWWDVYYPPNDWLCSCGVRPISKAQLKRLGKQAPDQSPAITKIITRDPATGEMIEYPKDVGMGWGYAPGQTWSDVLVPRELQKPLRPKPALPDLISDATGSIKTTRIKPKPEPDLPKLGEIAAPAPKLERMPPDLSEREYVDAFLSPFGAKQGKPKLVRDKAGHVLVVSEALFKSATGAWKVKKFGREAYMTYLAATLSDPDEIWVDWSTGELGEIILVRRYLRYFEDAAGFISFSYTRKGWEGQTAFTPVNGTGNPRPKYLENHRSGALLYRRAGRNE